MCVEGYVDIFRVNFEGVPVDNRYYVGHPVNLYFLGNITEGDGDFNSWYCLSDVGDIGDMVLVYFLYDGVAVVGD